MHMELDGHGLLLAVQEQNRRHDLGLVFYGATAAPREIRPEQVFWLKDGRRYPDTDVPVVCATDQAIVAAFMALRTPGRPWKYARNERGGMSFRAHPAMEEAFRNGVGYVAALARERFSLVSLDIPEGFPSPLGPREPEWRSTERQTPLFVVRVRYADFALLLEREHACDLRYVP
jgi:hypothetical protein